MPYCSVLFVLIGSQDDAHVVSSPDTSIRGIGKSGSAGLRHGSAEQVVSGVFRVNVTQAVDRETNPRVRGSAGPRGPRGSAGMTGVALPDGSWR